MRPTGFLISLSGSSRGNGNRDFFLTLSETLAFFSDSLSRVASMISGGQRSVAPPVMRFHSLRCGSTLGDFLCLVCLASSSEARYAHLEPAGPALFDAEMSAEAQRKPRASGLRSAAAPAHQTKAEPKHLSQ